MAGAQRDSGNGLGGRPYASFVGAALAAQPGEGERAVRLRRLHRFGPDVEEALVCLGQLALKRGHHLRADRVRVVELHDAPAGPHPVGRRARVAVDQGHRRAPPREASAEDKAGRPGADDREMHEGSFIE